jgi:hypothetical protein
MNGQQPVKPKAPTTVVVFGILSIVFGLFSLLGTAASAAFLFSPQLVNGGAPNPFLEGEMMMLWLKVSFALGLIAAIVLIVAGIGLLQMRRWAPRLAVGYSIYVIAMTVLGLVIQIVLMAGPAFNNNAGPAEAGVILAGLVGGVIGGGVSLIFPLLLWYYMTRPHIVAAFAGDTVEPVSGEAIAAMLVDDGTRDPANPFVSPRAEVSTSGHGSAGPVDSMVEKFIPSKNGPALASYYLGLLALFPCLGFFAGVAAVYLGIKGLRNVRANPEVRGGAHAWVGLVCGSVFGLFNFLLLAVSVVGGVVAAVGAR